ncbi:MAG TPA: M23 family metallopeptidase [Bryobacteraceae bacterium]|nr:M23 family metallopeptidase [Bryobacteraceae bacterium]
MKQEYFVVVLAHSLRGRLRRIHVPHQAVYAILCLALLGCFSVVGFVASYARMAWKVANYNALRRDADSLRARYQYLQTVVNQRNEQLASLQLFAKEVSVAFDIKQKLDGPTDISEGKLVPTFDESMEDYNYLRNVNALSLPSRRSSRYSLPANATPDIWPVDGLIIGGFGMRMDPFSGEGAFHKGVDIRAITGTPVRSTADGIVIHAGWDMSGYGRLVVVDHGGGIQTWYAHLSRINVSVGQEMHRGDVLGLVGSTGRVTAPHLHYEVHVDGVVRNPYFYLSKATIYHVQPRLQF